jgi:chaperone BCS1
MAIDHIYRTYLSSEITLTQLDEAYEWIIYWIKEYPDTIKQRHVSFLGGRVSDSVFRQNQPTSKDKNKLDISYVPSPGTYFIKYKGRTIWISYASSLRFGKQASEKKEENTIQITTYGGSIDILKEFINDARETFCKKNFGKTLVYIADTLCDVWEPKIARPKRDPSTVILKKGVFEGLITDSKRFLGDAEWYNKRGIPFRRGYLLHGPPGTGKTSTILALAGELDLNICLVNLASSNVDDEHLHKLMINVPENSIILLEDIDHVLEKNSGNVTFSGLLNAIDGVIAGEGRLLFMTTNNVLSLKDALIRPGRIDVICEINFVDDEQVKRMFQSFFPTCIQEAELFIQEYAKKGDKKVSPATLQGHFLKYKEQPKLALENVHELFQNRLTSIEKID